MATNVPSFQRVLLPNSGLCCQQWALTSIWTPASKETPCQEGSLYPRPRSLPRPRVRWDSSQCASHRSLGSKSILKLHPDTGAQTFQAFLILISKLPIDIDHRSQLSKKRKWKTCVPRALNKTKQVSYAGAKPTYKFSYKEKM